MFTSTSPQLAYGFISVFALASSVDHVGLAVHRSTGWAPPPWASAVLVLALAGAVGTLIVREISLTLRILLIIEAATAGVVLVLTLVLLVNLYLRGQMDWSLLALHQATPKNVGAGAAVVMTAFVGFESSTAIGAEATSRSATSRVPWCGPWWRAVPSTSWPPRPRSRPLACWTSPPRTADLRAREPKAIHRALRVLEAVAEIGPGATAKEVSQALEYPTATTYRLLNLLVQDGYLVRMPDLRGFALGRKVTALAGYVEAARVPTAVRALLEELRGQIHAGIHLIRIDGGRLTFVDTDDVFPPPALDAVRILRTGDLTALVHEATDLPSLVAPILDHSGQMAACLLLVGRPSPPPGDREARILSEYAERLTPLIV